MAHSFFVDFEAFQHGQESFKLKELCIINLDSPLAPTHYVFRPSKSWEQLDPRQQKTYHYITQRLHHLTYNEGSVYYCKQCIWTSIKRLFPTWRSGTFYVMGDQKKRFLEQEYPKLKWNLYREDTLPELPANITCPLRDHGKHCAYTKCYRMCHHHCLITSTATLV